MTQIRALIEQKLNDWREAGLLDEETARRILSHEQALSPAGLQPGRGAAIAFGLGALALSAGIMLYVAAHWDLLGPLGRSAVLVTSIVLLHGGAALASTRLPALATSLHAAGTAAYGAAIFLAGQTFHLAESWPQGLLLWAVGAAVGLVLLRDWPHTLWLAILVPAWLGALWAEHAGAIGTVVTSYGLLLLAIAYLGAVRHEPDSRWRRALARLGAICVLPLAAWHANVAVYREPARETWLAAPPEDLRATLALGWIVAVALPLLVGWLLRRRESWPLAVAALLAAALIPLDASQPLQELLAYLIYGAGSAGIVAWGLRDGDRLRVNVGVLCFACTLLFFYFASLYERLDRALGLVGVGLLLIGGGWWLERMRRQLLSRIEETAR